MERCNHIEIVDETVGCDAFDHPTMHLFCKKKNRVIRSERVSCAGCDCYRASPRGMIEKAIFIDGKKMLSPEINSVDFHAMTQADTEILGQFCDYTNIHGENLQEILLLGYLTKMGIKYD